MILLRKIVIKIFSDKVRVIPRVRIRMNIKNNKIINKLIKKGTTISRQKMYPMNKRRKRQI